MQGVFYNTVANLIKKAQLMKKTLLILLILIATSAKTFAEDIDLEFPLNIPNDIQANKPDFSPFDVPQKILTDKPEVPECSKDLPDETPSEKPEDLLKDLPPSLAGDEVPTVVPKVSEKAKLQDKVFWVNLIQDDEQKIREWAKISSNENYLIIDKKNCSAIVYDKDGNKLATYEIGLGRDIGDDFNDTSGLKGKARNTTPAGEFTLIKNVFNTSAYGDLTLSLGSKANKSAKSKKMVALHKVPKFRQERLCKFKDGKLSNNRMSHGCINFLEKDFKVLVKYIHEGFKVYILPEEEDNHLTLVKNEKGEFEFVQTKYQ